MYVYVFFDVCMYAIVCVQRYLQIEACVICVFWCVYVCDCVLCKDISKLRHVSYAMVSSGRAERFELLAHYFFMVRHMYITYDACRYGITTFSGDPSRPTVPRNQRGNCLSWLKEISDHLKRLPKNSNRQLPHNLALVGHGLQACIVISVL